MGAQGSPQLRRSTRPSLRRRAQVSRGGNTEIVKAFKLYDKDKSGSLSIQELKKAGIGKLQAKSIQIPPGAIGVVVLDGQVRQVLPPGEQTTIGWLKELVRLG